MGKRLMIQRPRVQTPHLVDNFSHQVFFVKVPPQLSGFVCAYYCCPGFESQVGTPPIHFYLYSNLSVKRTKIKEKDDTKVALSTPAPQNLEKARQNLSVVYRNNLAFFTTNLILITTVMPHPFPTKWVSMAQIFTMSSH